MRERVSVDGDPVNHDRAGHEIMLGEDTTPLQGDERSKDLAAGDLRAPPAPLPESHYQRPPAAYVYSGRSGGQYTSIIASMKFPSG